ncbi:hypothetical protein HDU91_004801, partial [Kappamyces sp. JEL0680]
MKVTKPLFVLFSVSCVAQSEFNQDFDGIEANEEFDSGMTEAEFQDLPEWEGEDSQFDLEDDGLYYAGGNALGSTPAERMLMAAATTPSSYNCKAKGCKGDLACMSYCSDAVVRAKVMWNHWGGAQVEVLCNLKGSPALVSNTTTSASKSAKGKSGKSSSVSNKGDKKKRGWFMGMIHSIRQKFLKLMGLQRGQKYDDKFAAPYSKHSRSKKDRPSESAYGDKSQAHKKFKRIKAFIENSELPPHLKHKFLKKLYKLQNIRKHLKAKSRRLKEERRDLREQLSR